MPEIRECLRCSDWIGAAFCKCIPAFLKKQLSDRGHILQTFNKVSLQHVVIALHPFCPTRDLQKSISLKIVQSSLTLFYILKFVLNIIWYFSLGAKSDLTRKDEIYNKLIDDFHTKGLDFPKGTEATDGPYIVQVHEMKV